MYELFSDKFNYIVRTQCIRKSRVWGGGLLHRLREHLIGVKTHCMGTVKANKKRKRYFLVCMAVGQLYPCVMALYSVVDNEASAMEAAAISMGHTLCNNYSKTIGVVSHKQKLESAYRQGKSKKKFKPAYLQNPAGSIDMEAVTKATHLFFKQRQAAKNHYYHVIERGRQLLNLQLLIKKPLKEAYWVAGKKMCGLHVGPLDMYSDVWFLFKYAAARLKLVDWWRCRKITLNGCHYTYKLFWLAKLNLLLSCQGSWIIDYFC